MKPAQSWQLAILLPILGCSTPPEREILSSFKYDDQEERYQIIEDAIPKYRPEVESGSDEWLRLRTVAYTCATIKASEAGFSDGLKNAQAVIFQCWEEDERGSGQHESKNEVAPEAKEAVAPQAQSTPPKRTATPDAADGCPIGTVAAGDVVAGNDTYQLRADPSPHADLIRNDKTSGILKRDVFHVIDTSTDVKRLCAHAGWTQVQIVEPEWLRHVKGWVPSSSFRSIETATDGTRIFTEDDFLWDQYTTPYKAQIIDFVNALARRPDGCVDVDTQSTSLASSRSAPDDPVFYVTCGKPPYAHNVYFRPSDA